MLTNHHKYQIIFKLSEIDAAESPFYKEVFHLLSYLTTRIKSIYLDKQQIRSIVKGLQPKVRNYPEVFALHEKFGLDGVSITAPGDAVILYLYIPKVVRIEKVLEALNEPLSLYGGINHSRLS
jgi:hypothetical protein